MKAPVRDDLRVAPWESIGCSLQLFEDIILSRNTGNPSEIHKYRPLCACYPQKTAYCWKSCSWADHDCPCSEHVAWGSDCVLMPQMQTNVMQTSLLNFSSHSGKATLMVAVLKRGTEA